MFGGFQVGPFQPLPAYQQHVVLERGGRLRLRPITDAVVYVNKLVAETRLVNVSLVIDTSIDSNSADCYVVSLVATTNLSRVTTEASDSIDADSILIYEPLSTVLSKASVDTTERVIVNPIIFNSKFATFAPVVEVDPYLDVLVIHGELAKCKPLITKNPSEKEIIAILSALRNRKKS